METKVSTRIRRLRGDTGLNRKEFANHISIPLRTIEDWRREEEIRQSML